MKRTLTLIAILLALLPATAQVRIVHKGKPVGHVFISLTGGSTYSKEAADILTKFSFTDAPFQVIEGLGPFHKGDIALVDVEGSDIMRWIPSEDAYRLVVDDRTIRIEGYGKGLVYGAVEFLKKYVGIDYWGEGEAYVPKHKELTIPAIDTIVTPTFRYRQSQNYMLRTDPLYKTWYHLEEPSEVFVANYWVHTCNRLLPASRYGAEHPEYYAYYNGKRNPGSASQWCMSNPEVLEIVCQRLDSLFKAYPDRKMVSISQNDGLIPIADARNAPASWKRRAAPPARSSASSTPWRTGSRTRRYRPSPTSSPSNHPGRRSPARTYPSCCATSTAAVRRP